MLEDNNIYRARGYTNSPHEEDPVLSGPTYTEGRLDHAWGAKTEPPQLTALYGTSISAGARGLNPAEGQGCSRFLKGI